MILQRGPEKKKKHFYDGLFVKYFVISTPRWPGGVGSIFVELPEEWWGVSRLK